MKILATQGTEDGFYKAGQLRPESLQDAVKSNPSGGLELELNMAAGYDHSYYFIASFVEEHLKFHADALAKKEA